MSNRGRWIESALVGFLIWVAVVLLAYLFAPGRASGVLLWQATLLTALTRYNIGTESEPFYEATPLTSLAYFAGILLGFPIYTAMTYILRSLVERATAKPNRLGKCLAKMKSYMAGP